MSSNFLGDPLSTPQRSAIISAQELIAREGLNLQKGMNFRDSSDGMLSVFLVLSREDGFKDEWYEDTRIYVYEGHDSTTIESGTSVDQLTMYESGRLSDNGKFYKVAHEFKDGVRAEPLQIQVYEKLDAGVWFDKGIFNLVDALRVNEDGRTVFKFHLTPPGELSHSLQDKERMITASIKQTVWLRDGGRCIQCGVQSGLHFVESESGELQLRCALHGGFPAQGLL